MSFIQNAVVGKPWEAGWFLADNEGCTRITVTALAEDAETADDGSLYVPAGTVFPSNDEYAVGIVYEDVDVTTGDMPASLVISGKVYEDRLPVTLDADAKTALEAKGFVFLTSPAVERGDE